MTVILYHVPFEAWLAIGVLGLLLGHFIGNIVTNWLGL